MTFSHFSIGARLAAGIALILTLSTGATGYALWTVRSNVQEFRQLAEVQFAQERQMVEWANRTSANLVRTLAVAKSGDPQVKAFFEPAMKVESGLIGELKKKIEQTATSSSERALLVQIDKDRGAYMSSRNELFTLLDAGKKADADKLLESRMTPLLNNYVEATKRLLASKKEQIDVANQQMQAAGTRTVNLLLLLSTLALLASVTVGWLITRGITGPLRTAVGLAQLVAAGDLRSRIVVERKDETGALLVAIAGMQDELRRLIGKVQNDVGAVSLSAAQLAASSAGLSDSSSQQSDAVSATAASIEELTVSITQVSESAQLASGVVDETLRVSESGLAKGNQVSAGIAAIDSAVSDFGGQMEDLRGQAANIGTVVKLIREIAEQTNLLALNAAIEAARAGEQGRGFAVVADEVRKLAERTSTATHEIQQTIEGIQQNMEQAGGRLDLVKSRVKEGVFSIRELVDPLKGLQEHASKAAQGLRELTSATREQQQVSEQIARNTEKIAGSAEQNHAAIAQGRATAGQLQDMAASLLESTSRFKLA